MPCTLGYIIDNFEAINHTPNPDIVDKRALYSYRLYPGHCEIFVGRSAFLSDASSPTLTMLPLISRALTEYHRPFFFQTTPYRSIVPSFSQLLAGCPNAHGLSHPLCVRAQTITKRQKLSDASTSQQHKPAQSSTNWQRQEETSREYNLAVLCQLAPPARTLCTLCTGSHTTYHFQMGEAPTRSAAIPQNRDHMLAEKSIVQDLSAEP